MPAVSLVFAAVPQWHQKLQEFHDQVPKWVARTGLPELDQPPLLNIAADFVFILAAIALLVALWRLLTLRIFRFLFAVIAAVLIAYYPAAYGFHWWLFEYDKEAKAARDDTPIESKIKANLNWIDYGIMAGGVLIGGTLLIVTRPRRQQPQGEYMIEGVEDQPAPWHVAQQEQQQAQRRSSRGQRQERNPFDFS